ncbi:hypothetical protein H4R34_003365 [Dimargaris verticillata]|uniref:SRA1/Sec31 domain-containing protein n=1 Tax=Dimargaris verticillata TaxID=2761393 RepID=A0A9W8E944_9FUNG|nr:hypothetical protein H4R34_003365 [Dimargaris verticillata]
MTTTDALKGPASDGSYYTAHGHWNDPPKALFHKKAGERANASAPSDTKGSPTPAVDEDPEVDPTVLKSLVSSLLASLQEKDLKGMDKRKLDDANRKMSVLSSRLDEGLVPKPVTTSLKAILDDLEAARCEQASAQFTVLMQQFVETEGKWLLGLRRLIELVTAQS